MDNLRYGNTKIFFEIPDHADRFYINEPEKKINTSNFTYQLDKYLKHLKPDLSDVVIVVADKTRLCGYPEYLPVLLNTLENFGAKPDKISILIAYGTHKRQNDEESYKAYGDSYKKYRFIHHDCTDNNLFISMGKTSRNTQVMIRKDILNASCLITFGAVSHHYFAGYGGGRKLIFPGLGFKKSIYQNHSLFLDKKTKTLSKFCQPGILNNNPLAKDLEEFENFYQVTMSVHGILNSNGQVCDLLIGSGKKHFYNVCAAHGKNCEIVNKHKYDMVIASCGGYPKDINFIQSHKAIHNAASFVKDNGILIVLAQCKDQIGSKTFLPWFKIGNFQDTFDKLAQNYEGNGGTALSMMLKTKKLKKIYMVTELSDNYAELINICKISPHQAVKMVKNFKDSLAVIFNASLLVNTGESNGSIQ